MPDPHNLPQDCLNALKHQQYTTFTSLFQFLNPTTPDYPYFLSHKLLYTLLGTKCDYYLLFEKITDFDNKHIKFTIEVERAYNTGSRNKLKEYADKMPDYSHVINMLMNNEERVSENEMYVEVEKNIERVKECRNILENYNKI